MTSDLRPDLCIIGGGSGGLSVAAGAVQMGASVVLVEGHKMGGDCLNYGCVPSKSLIAAAHRAQVMRDPGTMGVAPAAPQIDFPGVMAHVHDVIAQIEPHDSVARFEGLGVKVLEEWATFEDPRTVAAGATRIRARRFVIATGSSPIVPPIPGLSDGAFLTNETLWTLDRLPTHLIVIGGGPIGMEMAQAFRRLGSRVTVIEAATALAPIEPEIRAVALDRLKHEGIDLREGTTAERVTHDGGDVTLHLGDGAAVTGSHLLVAVGRRPGLDRLALDNANVKTTHRGVEVDKGLRSVSNRRVYAIGDAAGGLQFTHVAGYHAGLVVRSALFRLPVANRTDHIPQVTYLDPELAMVGQTEADAGPDAEVVRSMLAENDRARAEGVSHGMIKAVIGRRGKILGAAIAAPNAGDLIQPWALAISKGLKISDMAGHVAAYPTLGELSKRAAGAYFSPRLFESERVKFIVRLLAKLG